MEFIRLFKKDLYIPLGHPNLLNVGFHSQEDRIIFNLSKRFLKIF